PSSRQARRIRSAISPRLAMTIFSIMSGLFEDEQWLAEFDRVAVLRHDRGDAPGPVGFDLVHHLHRLDDAQHLPDLDLIADLDEARLFEELDKLLYLSDVHAAHALGKTGNCETAPAQGERASLAAAARTAAS